MAYNPSKDTVLNAPTDRVNDVNEVDYSEEQGYFNYDLTHQEMITPRFGEVTPSCHIHTSPGDRILHHDNVKTIHTKINGNLLNTVNQYIDSVFVPMRTYFPNNYEKLIKNPKQGDDLPHMAEPQIPLSYLINDYINSSVIVALPGDISSTLASLMEGRSQNTYGDILCISRWLLLSTIFSRGQLLDYLGCSFDFLEVTAQPRMSEFQKRIDDFQNALYRFFIDKKITTIVGQKLDLTTNDFFNIGGSSITIDLDEGADTMAQYRSAIADLFEKGYLVYPYFASYIPTDDPLWDAVDALRSIFLRVFNYDVPEDFESSINNSADPFKAGFVNIEKPMAYQLAIAQFYTRDSVDNVFNSELYMQNLRAVMYPSVNGFSSEPTFDYNGVPTEYDYISCGGVYHSLISQRTPGHWKRQMVWMSLVLMLRRSLRYGDYFSTARPQMLAQGQLAFSKEIPGGTIEIDTVRNLLVARYLNSVNRKRSGFLEYFSSVYGIVPSDIGSAPRFVSHRQIPLTNDITTNTADNQGAQTTNLIGFSDNVGYDVFIDDLGVLISLVSFDVLPIYPSGIENTYHFADRFDYFNPMLQNIGDQQIRMSELIGMPNARQLGFGYVVRNAEYKFKLSKAHGALVNYLNGFLLKLPYNLLDIEKVDSDFIRDKPYFFDSIVTEATGISPGEYWHFITAVTNGLQCARKIQKEPPLLF